MLNIKPSKNIIVKKRNKLSLLVLMLIALNNVFAQAPNISYQTPQTYKINTTITSLTPANAGGAVPPGMYGQVTTYAGGRAPVTYDAIGTNAGFNNPSGIGTDASGNIYVSDYGSGAIRKIDIATSVTTIATTYGVPSGLTLDQSGNIYASGFQSDDIYKITSNTVSTFAGTGVPGNADGTGTSASFNSPGGIATDAAGNVYVADQQNNKIRKITPAGVVTTIAGTSVAGTDNGPALTATFNNPDGLVVDQQGNVYVADTKNNLIRKISATGIVSTFAGSGSAGNTDGVGTSASFNYPTGICIDASGNFYVADFSNNEIRKITPAGVVTTLAGSGSTGHANATGRSATFWGPINLIVDVSGNLFVTDFNNDLIRKIALTGYTIDKPIPAGLTFDVTTGIITGTPTVLSPPVTYTVTGYNKDGTSTTTVTIAVTQGTPPNISYQTPQLYSINKTITPLAPANTGGAVPATVYGQVTTYAGLPNSTVPNISFNNPIRLTIDAAKDLFICDRDNNQIVEITAAGQVSVLASGFNEPNGITIAPNGNIYVTDAASNFIKQVTMAGVVSNYAGSGARGSSDGPAALASFYYPFGMMADATGNLYVTDTYNNVIRKITTTGFVTTFAGSGVAAFFNATGTAAAFNHPNCVAIDAAGNLYVTDPGNNLIRKITPAAVVTTFAGAGAPGLVDGPVATARFNGPGGICIDAAGNFFIADLGNNVIRKIDPAGIVTTLAGSGINGSDDGTGGAASFYHPNDVESDNDGAVYVTDYGNDLIRKVITTGYTIDKPLPPGLSFDVTTGIISGTPAVLSPATNYTVTAYNASGASITIVNIAVEPAVILAASATKYICDADFDPGATSNSGSPITYTSSNPAVATIIANKVHIVGLGTTTITATDGYASAQQVLTVITPVNPIVTIAAGQTTVCTGMPVTFTATVTNGGTNPLYQWQLNGVNAGTNSNTFTTTITPADVVQCTVTNSLCSVSGASNQVTGITVTPYVTPSVVIQSSATASVCSGTPIIFTATTTNGGINPTYQWQVNGANAGTSSNTFTSSNLADGDLVTCTLTNNSGACLTAVTVTSNTATVSLIPPPNPAPSVSITASANAVYTGLPITFIATPANAGVILNYLWKVNNVAQSSNGNTFTTSSLKNNAVVTCTIMLSSGCTVSVTSPPFVATVLPLPPVVIPNTFTPNGDGINDTWDIANLMYYPNCLLSVYNRYGAMVYQSKGYGIAWDGTYKGIALPVATYYYTIDLGNGTSPLSGSILIVR